MTLTEAITLGIVHGLTEPLPVSSSAHLVIIPALIPGFHQPGVFFDVVLHLGTLVAVVFFLRKDIAGAAVLKSTVMTQIPAGDLNVLRAGFLSAAGTGFFCLETSLCVNKEDRP